MKYRIAYIVVISALWLAFVFVQIENQIAEEKMAKMATPKVHPLEVKVLDCLRRIEKLEQQMKPKEQTNANHLRPHPRRDAL